MQKTAGAVLRHEVHARFVRSEIYEDPELEEWARQVLGPHEQQALARLRPTAARRDYLAAHTLARIMLAKLTGTGPRRVRFHRSSWRSPEIIAPAGARHLRMSLSHADGIALCAVASRGVIGADVESLRNIGPDVLGTAEAVCSPREMDALLAMPASARAERLLRLWTIKEAIAKATGLGFRFPITRVTVRWDSGVPVWIESDPGVPWHAALWRLDSLRLTPHHVAAIALLAVAHAAVVCRLAVPVTDGVGQIVNRRSSILNSAADDEA